MSNVSEKVGNATNDTVGNQVSPRAPPTRHTPPLARADFGLGPDSPQTLLNEATTLASHSLDYAKGLAGLGTSKTGEAKDAVKSDSAGGQTLGGLINEGRDLVSGTASELSSDQTHVLTD